VNDLTAELKRMHEATKEAKLASYLERKRVMQEQTGQGFSIASSRRPQRIPRREVMKVYQPNYYIPKFPEHKGEDETDDPDWWDNKTMPTFDYMENIKNLKNPTLRYANHKLD